MKYALTGLLALGLLGCSPSDDRYRGADRDAGVDLDDPVGQDNDLDPTDDDDDPTDDTPADDDDDGGDGGGDDTAWDSSPPDAGEGSIMIAEILCGLNEGPALLEFERRGSRWMLTGMDGTPNPAAEPCLGDEPPEEMPYLDWNSGDELYIWAAPFDHDLVPTSAEDRWIGEVAPVTEPSRECVDSLAAVGLSFPITMTLEILEIDLAN